MEISSIMSLSKKSEQLDISISELKQMKEVTFPKAIQQLEDETQNLKEQKQQYSSLIGASLDEEIISTIQTQRYEVEYLWVKLGNHATKNGITLKMDIAPGTVAENKLYNLNFTATGNYANITEFIYEIENDSTLGFKIENFKLLPSGGATTNTSDNDNNTNNETSVDVQSLVATFTVKNVFIDLDNIEEFNHNNTDNSEETINDSVEADTNSQAYDE